MVCERRTQKNEIFNLPSNDENINEEFLHTEFIEQLTRNIDEWNENVRIRERRSRRERIRLFCEQFNLFYDDSILLMTDEEFIRFKDDILKDYEEDVIAYCHRHEITYEEVLLNTPDDLYAEIYYYACVFNNDNTEDTKDIIIDNRTLEEIEAEQEMLANTLANTL